MNRILLWASVLSALVSVAMFFLMHHFFGARLPVSSVEVPPLSGLSPEQGRSLLQPRGLLLVLDGEHTDDKVAPGSLCDQHPLGGSRLGRGAEVHASLARPSSNVAVPAVVGQPLDAAKAALVAAKLRPGTVSPGSSDTLAKGMVMAATPPTGSEVRPDAVVDLVVSAGPSTMTIPSVVGKRQSKAKELLEKAGFGVGNIKYGSNDDLDQGMIISQNPPAGSQASPGIKIDLTIND